VPAVAAHLGVPLGAVVIGPGADADDLYYDWARLRGIDEDGVLLVRPDKIIAFRSAAMVDDPEAALVDALTAVLSRS
jgi:2,4-dichlorophenol 6-monooxygenase